MRDTMQTALGDVSKQPTGHGECKMLHTRCVKVIYCVQYKFTLANVNITSGRKCF